MISQYLYISTAPSLSREDVDAILAASQRNNAARGVTGLLLYNGRNFLQLLEGEESELVSLMVKISHDSRHTGISMIDRRLVEKRACPNWAMRRVMIAESVEKRRDLLKADLPEGLDAQTSKIITNFVVLN
ncbi:MAG: BLUF domain-containing protein [Erythrobacter sp.]|uniref:BLUF domain-containing protein n=1 Tax=Erythrobacter sp. TaxID=1042 RepID=UPI002639B050|nr:BLUF domain-containing protein [Erythrobacter sp.]MDJ0978474.1 BLUF domain-containing protein [Erythrobacter sp.]